MNAPDEITHYYSAADKPFRSLSDLAPDDLAKVLTQLKDRKAANPE